MRIDPQLNRLRLDPAPGIADAIAADAAIQHWRDLPEVVPILADLERHGGGAALGDCPALHALMTGGTASPMRAMLLQLCATLHAHVLGQPRLAASRSPGTTRLVFAEAGRSALSLVLSERVAGASGAGDYAVFADGELHLLGLAGAARATFVQRDAAGALSVLERSVHTGSTCTLDLAEETLNLAPDASFVSLRLNRRADRPGVMQQVDLASGALVHQSAADPEESRIELAMALLRAMGRSDGAEVVSRVARRGSAPLRWQALRECLALDAATGFGALLETARDSGDPLASHARALARSLAARHPALAHLMEDKRCPA